MAPLRTNTGLNARLCGPPPLAQYASTLQNSGTTDKSACPPPQHVRRTGSGRGSPPVQAPCAMPLTSGTQHNPGLAEIIQSGDGELEGDPHEDLAGLVGQRRCRRATSRVGSMSRRVLVLVLAVANRTT